ncbi:MAG: 3-methyl-2-oxobutanoate hydroxymethyltransferase [Gemmatimonadota bacterium]|nr:3-methyl-2-oxobutanoate hydroxymethyltransferase [Gemmatimonadota bacterium]
MSSPLDRLVELYSLGVPIVMLTAYDFPSARVAVGGGVDVILVGDSAAMTVLGYSSTRDISIDELLMLTSAVRRAATEIPVIGDLPFGSYETSDELAVASALRFANEAGCDAVKLEGGGEMIPRVRAIIEAGVPVVGHVGLLPQSVRTREGYRARGRDPEQALGIIADADALAGAGCVALVVEAVPAAVTRIITSRAHIPVIGIGAGVETGGQVIVYHDLLGFSEGRSARFVRTYASAREDLSRAVAAWAADVRTRSYPAVEHTYPITAEALAEVVRCLETTT